MGRRVRFLVDLPSDYPIVYKGMVLFDDKGVPNLEHPDLVPYRPVGFRAPELGHNSALYRVLERMGYVYDTSKIAFVGKNRRSHQDHVKHKGESFDLWLFPLIKYRGEMATVPMDYNYLVNHHSGGQMEADYKRALIRAAQDGTPWNIGHHFSLWNGGAYWKALQHTIEFAAQGCPSEAGERQCNIEFRTFRQMVEEDLGDPKPQQEEPNPPNS